MAYYLEQAIDTLLRADTTLTALVGGSGNPRIYWMQAGQTTQVPYVVYTIIDDMDDAIAFGNTDTGNARVQFDVVGDSRDDKAIAYQIRSDMRYKVGTASPVTFYISMPGGIRERYNAELKRFIWTLDYIVRFSYA